MRFPRHNMLGRICLRELKPFLQRNFSSTTPSWNGYYVLLPAVPEDTAENNPLLQTTGPPQYGKISDSQVLAGLGKITIDYESAFYRLEEDILQMKEQRTFVNVLDRVDRLNHPLVHAFSTARTLNATVSTPALDNALLTSEQAVLRCQSLPTSSATLLSAVKEISKEQTNLSEAQQRVLSNHVMEGRLNGSELNSNDYRTYRSILAGLRQHQNKFRSNLVTCSADFHLPTTDPAYMDKNTPQSAVAVLKKDRTTMALKTSAYESFMTYCAESRMRQKAWQAIVSRAAFDNPDTNNSLVIEDIRQMRTKEAKIMGHENYAALSMETKMARSVKNVMARVSEMTIPCKTKCQTDLMELQKFAGDAGFRSDLQLWDVAYWRRKQREDLYQIDNSEVSSYFPFPVVLDGLFKLLKDLFGITIKEGTKSVPVWHADVQFYRVLDSDSKELGGFYLDPYARPGQKSPEPKMELGQYRNDAAEATPLASLIFSFPASTASSPSLLSFEDLSGLLQKFGSCLQHILTTVPYGPVSGLNGVEWEALHVSGNVLRMFLQNGSILKRLSRNTVTGNEIPDDLVTRLLQYDRHLSSLDLLSSMYFSVLDLSFYTRSDFWQDIMKDIWRDYIPFPLDKQDAHPCGFAHIFVGNYAASYYSFFWAEMVAADVYSAFTEADFTNEREIKHVATRFRETFLSLGGSCHSAEVFRRFRGRDPSSQALLRLLNIS